MEPLAMADSMPKFPNGLTGVAIHIQTHFAVPPQVRETQQSAKAFVKFVVDTNGKVVNPVVVKTSGFKEFDTEAIRVISKMPLWEPGLDKNKKAAVYMTIPVSWKNDFTRPAVTEESPKLSENQKKALHYNKLGVDQAMQERYDFALAKFDLSLKYDSTLRAALFNKADIHLKLNQKQKACETWKKYVSLGYQSQKVDDLIKANCN
jgi:TonB family protein